jgi:glutathione synthase/RimK-type ligase-like ATP-grasp enzyme
MRPLNTYPFFIRLMHWEYWNSKLVYAPLYPYWLWLSIKARSFFFLTSANPKIENGGFIMESKMSVYNQMPEGYYPATVLVQPNTAVEQIEKIVGHNSLGLPLIVKPDYGERGLGVQKVASMQELVSYALSMPIPFLIQSFVSYKKEAGIFFVKLPGEATGRISGIVNKEPVAIVGDGKSTFRELVFRVPRYILQWRYIQEKFRHRVSEVLLAGEELVLIPYGNHVRGSLFTNETARLNPRLNTVLLNICNAIPDFNFGRLDIKFESWEELQEGRNFSIIELNGSGSEPTHIYDPKQSIFFAWREIIKHWRWLYIICKHQNKQGVPSLTYRQGQTAIKAFKDIEASLLKFNV